MLVTADDRRRALGLSRPLLGLLSLSTVLTAMLVLAGCEGSGIEPEETSAKPLLMGESIAGPAADELVVTVTGISGASRLDGSFAVGDSVEVTFTVATRDGDPVGLADLSSASILLSGPTHNYQPVLVPMTDVLEQATVAGGAFVYRFAATVPATYPAPFNNSDDFGVRDGELQGLPLEGGTYTVGLAVVRHAGGAVETGSATRHVAFLGAEEIDDRELAKVESCNTCHVRLGAHGGTRRDLRLCVLCHTSGAEDLNDPALAGGTPGVSVDIRVLIHKIHNGAHLPSVLGMRANADGSRRYDLSGKPYVLARSNGQVVDYSAVNYPMAPNVVAPLPRDIGHGALPASAQAIEDAVRRGASDCEGCHGDPDGDGPIEAPAEAGIIYSQPTRRACGACHDDIEFAYPYTANGITMPPIYDDVECLECHMPRASDFGGPLAANAVLVEVSTEDAHKHPLRDPALNAGLVATVSEVSFVGDGVDAFGAGAGLEVAFTVTDGAGTPVAASDLDGVTVVVSGPAANPQHLLTLRLGADDLGSGPTYRVTLAETVQYEVLGASTAAAGEMFVLERSPRSAQIEVFVRGAIEHATVLHTDVAWSATSLTVSDASGIDRGDTLAVDDGTEFEQVVAVTRVEGRRIFVEPSLTASHEAGAAVSKIPLTAKVEGTDFSVDLETATVTELVEFGAGSVLVTYTTDYMLPAVYPAPPNDSALVGEASGEWSGKPLVDGTYQVGLAALKHVTFEGVGEATEYAVPSVASVQTFAIGEDTGPVVEARGGSCTSCHGEVLGHGGRYAGFEACQMCHGAAGIEDRSPVVAGNAPATPGQSVRMASLLHGIHLGGISEVVGYGHGDYPDNFSVASFAGRFPADSGLACGTCHAADQGPWQSPRVLDHPDGQEQPSGLWAPVCSDCHMSTSAARHMAGPHECSPEPGAAQPCSGCHEGGSLGLDQLHGGVVEPEPAGTCDGDGSAPTYDDDLRTILQARCAPCHSTELACGTHTSLETYEATKAPLPGDASQTVHGASANRAEGIGGALMPPPGFGVLSEDEVATLRAWSDAGAPRCD